MCLAIPGRVDEILNEGDLLIGRVNFGGIVKRVCLDYVPDIQVGDYAIVHVGFALSKLDAETAEKTLEVFRKMGMLEEELASEEEAFARAASAPQSNCPDGSCEKDSESASQQVSEDRLRFVGSHVSKSRHGATGVNE
jgi:hydrogenase expression/formation protein HypC